MPSLQLLIITMNKKDSNEIVKLLDFLNVDSDAIVCNQTDTEEEYELSYKEHSVLVHSYKERGVSLNRNTAASLAKADILLFSDDDTPLVKNYTDIVVNAFKKQMDAEVILFSRESHDPQFDSNYYKDKKVKRFSEIGTIGGSGVAILSKAWEKYELGFPLNFGSPNYFFLGEDSLFGKQLIIKKVNVYTNSNVLFDIVLNNNNSSYFTSYDKRYFESVGACAYYLHKNLLNLYILYKAFVWKRRIHGSFFSIKKYLKNGVKLAKAKSI